jgi:hypothetical protein
MSAKLLKLPERQTTSEDEERDLQQWANALQKAATEWLRRKR